MNKCQRGYKGAYLNTHKHIVPPQQEASCFSEYTTFFLSMELKIPIADKWIKLFHRRGDDHSLEDIDDGMTSVEDEDDKDHYINEE